MMTINPDGSVAISHMTLEHLLAETGQYLSPREMETIQRAYEVANEAHRGVVRISGDPYIQHPLEVALLLAGMTIDADGIVSALLTDVVEDTIYSLDDLRTQFGTSVASIVDGVTKFDALDEKSAKGIMGIEHTETPSHPVDKQRQRTETVRKMLIAMAEDPRVVVLKLADRLHNMRTLEAMKPSQKQRTARETSEIYAPLARRMGMNLAYAELQDLSFCYLEPEKYACLTQEVEAEIQRRQPYIDQ